MVPCSTCFTVIALALVWRDQKICRALLYPQESETRERVILNGIWNFRLSTGNNSFPLPAWYKKDLSQTGPVTRMPVPASYNDITQNTALRDHVGLVWYDRTFYVPHRWKAKFRVWLRFSSVHHSAMVWVNTKPLMCHNIGHLPFEQDVTNLLKFGGDNLLTVACNNTLTKDTIPQGKLSKISSENETCYQQRHNFRFFHYAGIHRSVFLYTTPYIYINKIKIKTDVRSSKRGVIRYSISYRQYEFENDFRYEEVKCMIELLDRDGSTVTAQQACTGVLRVVNAHLWWPYLMSKESGYLYTLQVSLSTDSKRKVDVYRQKIGIRTVKTRREKLLINDVIMYMRGVNLYEDSNIRGQGSDLSVQVKNFNLIRWIGANTLRTAYYPHSEEAYQLADELGIMIIDQCPSSNLLNYTRSMLAKLIERDEKHPSVIMWSIADMSYNGSDSSSQYFGEIAKYVRALDPTRPIAMSLNTPSHTDEAARHVDVISIRSPSLSNHFNITKQVVDEITKRQSKYKYQPVLMSEYGAGSISHQLYPEYGWSVDGQVKLMSQYFRAFDLLKGKTILVGEFFANLADFEAAEPDSENSAVELHKKGILTRTRQPRASAHHLRRRYYHLAKLSNDAGIPDDLYNYIIDSSSQMEPRSIYKSDISNQIETSSKYKSPWLVTGMREYEDKPNLPQTKIFDRPEI